MLDFMKKIQARRECAAEGHDWKGAGTAWDYDSGMGGGREMQKIVCARCGARSMSVFKRFEETTEAGTNA